MNISQFRKANKISQVELAEYLGVTQGFVSQMEKGTSAIPEWIISKILANSSWNVSAMSADSVSEEEDLRNECEQLRLRLAKFEASPSFMVPVLPVMAQAGPLQEFCDGVREYECEKTVSPIPGADLIIPIMGESMAPEYPNGSRIVVKKINDKAFIEWGKVYCLSTMNGAVVKELHKSDDDNEVICYSLNPDPKYAPFAVKRDDILGVYRVLMCMSMK